MRNLFHFALVIFVLLTASGFLVAQTELMDDVSAVKEDSDEDLYAPDDEAAGSASAAPSSAASLPPRPPQNSADLLEDLPVAGGDVRPDTALTGTDNNGTAELSAIRIYSLADRTRFEIQTSKIVDYSPERSSKNKQFTLNLANTNLGPLVSKGAIDAKEYGGPVKQVQAYESRSANGSSARVVMNMTSASEPSVRREGNRIIVDFFGKGYASDNQRNSSDIPDNFETLIALNGKQSFVGTKVNFRAKEATIPDVLQFISQVSGRNFVLVGETDKKISMNVKSVPWDQVLALVLLNADLGYQKMGNTYRVMQVTKIRQEIADSIKAQEDEDKLAPKATQLFPLSYAKTTEVIPQISKYLKPEFNENVVSDERTNSIVVTALPKNIQRIRRYIEAIDRQTPVVHIEARIIQAQKEFSRDIGINWSAIGGIKLGGGTLSIGGGVFGSSGSSSSGGSSSASSQTGVLSLLGGAGGAAGQYLNPNGTIQQIDTVVKFNESLGVAKELSRPSLTVLNNKKASIVDGTELTLLLNTGEGENSGTTKTVKAALSLTVTPQVTNDENILLDLVLTRDSLAPLVGDNINVNKREISTQTLIESGATVVVGGVYIKEDNKGEAGWPFVRKIPILGRLFTSTDSTIENERELLMFISPRILNRERAQVLQQSLEDAR